MNAQKIRMHLGLALAAWLAVSGVARAVAVGDKLDKLALPRIAGGELGAADLVGKVTVINFWATWCEACKVEFVEMEKLLVPLKAKGLQLAFVSLDKEVDKASAWFRANLREPKAMLADLYSDANFKLADQLSVDSFPMTLVVGRDGRVVQVQRGFKEGEGSTEAMVKLAEKLLTSSAH